MANLGRGDNVDETSLAAATAAIITARWGGPARRAQAPEPALVGAPAGPPSNGAGYAGNGHGGATYGGGDGDGGSVDDTPLTYRRDAPRYEPPADYGHADGPYGPADGPYGPADGPPPAPAQAPGAGFARAEPLPSRLSPDRAAQSGTYGGGTPNGGTPNGGTPNGGTPSGGTYGGNGARATATVDRPPPPPLIERSPEPAVEPARDSYRGAGSPPPMFTPATFAPMPEVFEPPLPPEPRGAAPFSAPGYEPEPFAAFVPPPPDVYAPPHPYPPGDGHSRPPAGVPAPSASTLPPAPSATTLPPAPSATTLPPAPSATTLPGPGGLARPPAPPPAPSIPAQRSPEPDVLAAPGFAATDEDDFTGSVMSGLAFPEPFVPEPYDPSAFSLAGFGSDGGSANGYDGGSFGYTENGNGHHGAGPASATATAPAPAPTNGHHASDQASGGQRIAAGSRAEGRARRAAQADIDTEAMLPRRVPSVPDVPDVFLANDPAADGFELTRIASYLREEKVDETDNRPDGFDVAAVLAAVRGVTGVRDAQLRWNTGYGHTLRVEFDPGADEGEVTRLVAGMLRDSMGLAAQPGLLGPAGATGPAGVPGSAGMPGPAGVPGSGGPGPAGMSRFNGDNTLERHRRAAGVATVNPTSRSGRAEVPQNRPMPVPARTDGAAPVRVVLDHVQVTTLGAEATVDVRLALAGGAGAGTAARGTGQGPAVDAYVLRLAASAAGDAIDQLLVDPASRTQRGRVFIEHVSVVPFGSVEVAVVVALLMCGPEAEQMSGSAIVTGDPRHAVVRATLSAVNRRLESLLA